MNDWTRRGGLSALAAIGLTLAGCDSFFYFPAPKVTPLFKQQAHRAIWNWESPHVHPLELSPDQTRLFAVNTADHRLEVFDVAGDEPRWLGAVFVGLEPVSVRARTSNEVWVVNHVSDSVSIVDLETMVVRRTLLPGDEPTDVAFAGSRAFVVCSQLNQVVVVDLNDLDAAPLRLDIQGEDPRAFAVSPDGRRVFLTIFESGNATTLVPWEAVSDPRGPYGGLNPPPNRGVEFDPPISETLPPPLPVSQIVRKDPATGAWLDENGADWSEFITWDVHDHDLAIIDADSLAISYASGLMTADMALTALADGRVMVVGTEATNEIRFEPNLTGRFVHSVAALVDASTTPAATSVFDLNPHLAEAYAAKLGNVPPAYRDRSIADPRAVVFTADGAAGFVAGMGSDNVAVLNTAGARIAEFDAPSGPTGLQLDEARQRLYVLSRFDAAISVVDVRNPATPQTLAQVSLFDPTPAEIREGRPFLYNARKTSGLGVTACGACHIDARMDQLAWDLGNPAGEMKGFNEFCNRPFLGLPAGPCEDWHPMKGPMTTQTLQNIPGTEPFHWRGDRENLAAFNDAFLSLLGADRELTDEEMQAFETFLGNIQFPPNPNRNLDDGLKEWLDAGSTPIEGSPTRGEQLYLTKGIDLGLARCVDCHALDNGAGTNGFITPRNLLIIPNQSIDVPQTRNMHEKTGFSKLSQSNSFGFGHNHDGNVDGLVNFFHIPNFTGFTEGPLGDQERRDIIAFVFSMSTDTHAAVGAQLTLGPQAGPPDMERWDLLHRIADSGLVGLVAHGRVGEVNRGYSYAGGGVFIGADGPITSAELLDATRAGAAITLTITPAGLQTRLAAER